MKGVLAARATPRPSAYCLGTDGGEDGAPCPYRHEAGPRTTLPALRAEAKRHARETGHEVYVDVLDRTAYTPEPAARVTP